MSVPRLQPMGYDQLTAYLTAASCFSSVDVMFRFFVANRDGVTGELAIDVRHTSWNYGASA